MLVQTLTGAGGCVGTGVGAPLQKPVDGDGAARKVWRLVPNKHMERAEGRSTPTTPAMTRNCTTDRNFIVPP